MKPLKSMVLKAHTKMEQIAERTQKNPVTQEQYREPNPRPEMRLVSANYRAKQLNK